MANTDDLDDFFKKKDRKGNKAKKQTGLLTNNEELLKQLGNDPPPHSPITPRLSLCSDCHFSNISI